MTVTAVIPTTGRASLARSVGSALLQRDVSEVLVVADGRAAAVRAETVLSSMGQADDSRLQLHVALDAGNGSKVRNFGTRLARNHYIAYCDDDDYWLHNKVEDQLRDLGTDSSTFSTHAYWRRASRSNDVMPAVPCDTDDLGSLLLIRDSISYQRGFCATPTILVPTEIAKSVGWDEKLRRHQDWDFVMRLQREGNLQWRFLPKPLSVVDATTTSVSRGVTDAEPAEYFLKKHAAFLEPIVAADFTAVHIAGVHFRSGHPAAGLRALRTTSRKHCLPHPAAIAVALLRLVQQPLHSLWQSGRVRGTGSTRTQWPRN